MSVTQVRTGAAPAAVIDSTGVTGRSLEQPRNLQRTFQLVLATVWLLDAVLQLQPFMFTRGSNGLSGMLNNVASGNPGWVAHSITWNASNVYHDPVLTNSIFALVQFLIGFGIVWKRSLNSRWRSPSSGPWASGGSGKAPGTSFTAGRPPWAVGLARCSSMVCWRCCSGRARARTYRSSLLEPSGSPLQR